MIQKKEFKVIESSFDREGKSLSFETWKLAVQADSSIRLQLWENVILITTCMEKNPRPETDFMPLMIDFRESYAAAWRIAGAMYRRRESRPSDNNILYARMADRALRPMFPKGMINDTVITLTPMALDHQHDLDVMTIVGWSISIMAAGIPFDGPVGAVQIGYENGQFIINPTKDQIEKWMCNLLVAWKKWSINMIECGAKEMPKDVLKQAFLIAQKQIDYICDIQNEFLKKLTIQKKEVVFNKPSEALIAYISNILTWEKLDAMTGFGKESFNDLYYKYEKEVLDICKEKIADPEQEDFTESKVKMAVFHVIKYFIRSRTLQTGKRIDDRGEKDIRPLYCEVGVLPRVHGSGLFWRGDTQVLNTTTLWWPKDYLLYDDMENDGIRQTYFHHYNFPPFSVGEAKGTRWQNRREIGHGKLAEKALIPLLPSKEVFPYCIRTVSECLGSGWSTSMGSVCASTLSLMDAGVPLIKPVAGIAMGLMTDHDENDNITKHIVLDDLQGTEDFTGDMDFKVAGTKDGVTAIQLDTKLKWLTMNIVHETMDRAFEWYNQIMDFMLQTIDKPRNHVGQYAPKIFIIKVAMDKIKEVIWKWWDVINKIIEDCNGIKIDFEDDGTCYLTHPDQEMIDKATAIIKEIVTDLEAGQEFDAKITRIEDYGLFVQLPKNKLWLCHISNLWQKYQIPLSNHFKIWDKIRIKIKGIDHDGKVAVIKI
jgi:polyribonucleotide nucleotidyltransferase